MEFTNVLDDEKRQRLLYAKWFWSCCPRSSTVSQPKWREHKHFYKWSAATEGIQRPKSLNWQKTGTGAGCHDHFTACGCCQQHLEEQDSQLRSSLVALQQRSGKRHTKGLMQRVMLTGPGKAACRGGGMWWWGGGEQQQGAWWHCCQTGMGWCSKKPWCRGSIMLRLNNWNIWFVE